METLTEKVSRVVKEEVAVVPHDPGWAEAFEQERRHLRSCLPADLLGRIEHFGSTAVPGLPAKPIVDMLVEVTSLDETKRRIAPVLEAQGYEYFWRPSWGDDTPPFYAWFIKRDAGGKRTLPSICSSPASSSGTGFCSGTTPGSIRMQPGSMAISKSGLPCSCS